MIIAGSEKQFCFIIYFLFIRKGNDCFGNKDYSNAIEHYTEGLKVDPNNAVLFSNRRYEALDLVVFDRP